MFTRLFCYLLIAAVMPLAAHASDGTGTVVETETAIIVEFSGNEEDANAARSVEEREEKLAEAEADKRRSKLEQSKLHTSAKQAARLTESANAEPNPGEERQEEQE